VKTIVNSVFRHRLILSYDAHASNTTPDQVIDRITALVAVS
jgi:MoxR-like ATPase